MREEGTLQLAVRYIHDVAVVPFLLPSGRCLSEYDLRTKIK